MRGLRRARRAAILAGVVVALVIGLAAVWLARPLPPGMLDRGTPSLTLEDRFGRVLRTTRSSDGMRGGWLPLAEMDADLVAAFLAAEDRRFHRHRGVDFRAVGRAARSNQRAGRNVSGGSTITMQVARMLRPVPRTRSGNASQSWTVITGTPSNRARLGKGSTPPNSSATTRLS